MFFDKNRFPGADKFAQSRISILIICSLATALIIFLRFAFIMLSPDRATPGPRPSPIQAERGPIIDRKGRLLALQTHLWSVTAWKPEITDPEKTAQILAEILDMTAGEINTKLNSTSSRFVFIERKVTPTQSDSIRQIIENGDLSGINLQEESARHYPMKQLAANLIGYVGIDNVGLDGVEYAFDRVLAPGGISTGQESTFGHSVQLTIDMNAQYLVERIADEAWQLHNPDSMMILVMDASSGEILIWISRPGFDPNTFTLFSQNDRINRPVTVAYEPGSVFKTFTWSIFIDLGGVNLDRIFDTRAPYEPELFRKNHIPPLTDLGQYGVINLAGALSTSSNIAIAQASENINSSDFYQSLKNFGFGAPTGLPLPGESYGLLRPVKDWSLRSKPTIAIGQEIGISAVQIISAATALTNGGILLKPRIVKEVRASDGSLVKRYERQPLREVLSPKTARTMLELLEGTVQSGTSRLAAVPGLRISAKSGTAQITDPKTGTYSTDRFLSSALAIFPTEKPRLITYVVIENPQGSSIYGAQTAVPMIRDIASTLSTLMNIPMEGDNIINRESSVHVTPPVARNLGDVLHDMTGYSKRMLIPYLARQDIKWRIDGEGWVVFQFPPPGTPVKSGMSIFLELE